MKIGVDVPSRVAPERWISITRELFGDDRVEHLFWTFCISQKINPATDPHTYTKSQCTVKTCEGFDGHTKLSMHARTAAAGRLPNVGLLSVRTSSWSHQ